MATSFFFFSTFILIFKRLISKTMGREKKPSKKTTAVLKATEIIIAYIKQGKNTKIFK